MLLGFIFFIMLFSLYLHTHEWQPSFLELCGISRPYRDSIVTTHRRNTGIRHNILLHYDQLRCSFAANLSQIYPPSYSSCYLTAHALGFWVGVLSCDCTVHMI
ncbi:unnamed protein product [Sphacelaria rigidula]